MIIHPKLIKKTATFQTKTINPSVTTQEYLPDSGKDGFSKVTITGVDSSIDSNIQAAYIKKGIAILGVTGTFEGSASDQPSLNKTSIVVSVTKPGGTAVNGASITITDTSDSSKVYTGISDANGRFYKELNPGTYTVSVADIDSLITPDIQTVEASANEANYVYMHYTISSVTYGVKIDLANSNPETAVTYTDDAVGFEKSYMDFTNDAFMWGSWQDKFPFNQIRPCLFKDGAVVKYLNPNDYTKDINGNDAVITGADGDVMIEIPKIYYKLHKDENYQYIQISDTAQDGFCCLAHTYKGVEKNKVYIGAYQAYYDGTKARSVSGVSATGSVSMNTWRTYCQNQGAGYEQFYWHLLVLLETLFVIQFKNLNSQAALGYGWCNSSSFSTGGGLDKKGMNYCASATANAQLKFLGIEDFYGSRRTWIDGTYTSGTKLTIADVTSSDMAYNGSGTNYIEAGDTGLSSKYGYTKAILGSNLGGFTPTDVSGSSSTYYSDYANFYSGYVLRFGGYRSNTTYAGAFILYFSISASNTDSTIGGRLAFCG